MNLEICKHCLGVKTVKFIVNSVYDLKLSTFRYNVTVGGFPIGLKSCSATGRWFEDRNELTEEVEKGKPEQLLELTTACPYYAEHMIEKWNKE